MARDSRSSPLRWLHISDLHLRAGDDPGRHADRTYEQNIVLEALIRSFDDPALLGKLKPDVIFCTGDIAHGGKAEEYQEALRALDDLCEVTGVDGRTGLFLVPGNHDLDRARATIHLDPKSRDAIFGASADAIESRRFLLRRFEAYARFQHEATGQALTPEQPFNLRRLRLRGLELAVVGFNTAWFAHNTENLQGKLVISERVVREALKKACSDTPDLVVALMHHPLDWLQPEECQRVSGLLFERCHLLLHGHLHVQTARFVRTTVDQAALLPAGATYQGREWPNMAMIGEVDSSAGEVRVQGINFFSSGRGLWRTAPDMAPTTDGVFVVELHGLKGAVQPTLESTGVTEAGSFDQARYLRHLRRGCGAISLQGLLSDRAAATVPLDEVYVPLHASWPASAAEGRDRAAHERSGEEDMGRLIKELQELAGKATEQEEPPQAARTMISSALEAVGLPREVAADDRVIVAAWSRIVAARDRDRAVIETRLRAVDLDTIFRWSLHLLVVGGGKASGRVQAKPGGRRVAGGGRRVAGGGERQLPPQAAIRPTPPRAGQPPGPRRVPRWREEQFPLLFRGFPQPTGVRSSEIGLLAGG